MGNALNPVWLLIIEEKLENITQGNFETDDTENKASIHRDILNQETLQSQDYLEFDTLPSIWLHLRIHLAPTSFPIM